jgi:hypothetical protein
MDRIALRKVAVFSVVRLIALLSIVAAEIRVAWIAYCGDVSKFAVFWPSELGGQSL